MSEGSGEKRTVRVRDVDLLIVSVIVWAVVGAAAVAMVIYGGMEGIVFAFVALVVAVGSWSRVMRDGARPRADREVEEELLREISDLRKSLEELRKSLEE